jgi:O-antigen ligase
VLLATLYFTYSRGGFLGLCAGLAGLFYARYGWRKSLALGVLVLPVLLVLFGGRMTSIDTKAGTGQSRIQLWSDWLDAFRTAPVLGVGPGADDVGISHAAHNSFLQAYADMGIFGGILFVGAFYLAALTLLRAENAPVVSPEMRRLRPYLLATVAGSMMSLFTLCLTYLIPTYLILGLATAYSGVARASERGPLLRWDLTLCRRLAVVGVSGLGMIYVCMRLFRAG